MELSGLTLEDNLETGLAGYAGGDGELGHQFKVLEFFEESD